MKHGQPEYRLQCALARAIEWRARPGLLWSAFPSGEKRSAATGARLKAMGVKQGWPDLIFLWAGHAIGIELKVGKGRLSPAQEVVRDAWIAAGHIYRVFNSYDETLAFLEGIGALVPDRSLIRPQTEAAA